MEKDKSILRYGEAAQFLPSRLRQAAMALPQRQQAEAEEFRLRAGRPLSVLLPAGELPLEPVVEPEDLETMYAMENDPQTWDVTNFSVPYSKYVLKQYMENSQCDMFADRQLRMMIVRCEDNAVVGTIDITDFAPMHSRGEVGIAVRREYQGKGYASDALRLLCDYAFGFLFLKQLIVHVAADNEVSLRLFGSMGFVRCGLLKEWWFVGGKFKDVILMQRIRPEKSALDKE